MAKKKLSFEESIRRLDEIVRHLESGDLPLEESLTLFEEGTALVSSCSTMLNEAEQKVSILRTGRDGALAEEPYDGEEYR